SAPPRDLRSFPTRRSSDLGAEARFAQRRGDLVNQVGLRELPARQVDAHRHVLADPVNPLPLAHLPARLAQDPLAEACRQMREWRSEEHRLNSSHVEISYAV